MFILGWTPRGCATASATALFGPWPYSPFAQRSLRPSSRHHRSGRLLGWGRSPTLSIRRGSSLPSSGRPGRSLTTKPDLPQLLHLGMGGPRAYSIFHPNYGFVPVAATPVLDRHGGDSGEANGRNFRRRRSPLPSVSSLMAVASS
jgi:hypothetical protein